MTLPRGSVPGFGSGPSGQGRQGLSDSDMDELIFCGDCMEPIQGNIGFSGEVQKGHDR